MDTNLTHQDFFRELLAFRELMGDRNFWAKSYEKRELAKKGFGITYLNTVPASDQIASHFEGTMMEYDKRELLMFKAGLTAIS